MRTYATYVLAVAVSVVQGVAGEDPNVLSRRIDEHINRRIAQAGAEAAPVCSDEEFIRRVYLDVAGKIPPVSRVREFIASKDPAKRSQLVDELLESSRYVVNFTTMWRNALIPEAVGDLRLRQVVPGFEAWLRTALDDDLRYDEFVRRIVDAPLDPTGTPEQYVDGDGPTAAGFYVAKEGKPENLASAVSRVFLGRRLECAQCHDHPFDTWKQQQFWQFAAFFSGIDRSEGAVPSKLKPGTLVIPDTEEKVSAAFLDGKSPALKSNAAARRELATWIIDRNNPYFAEMAANRLWGHFFGRGIVEPVDDFAEDNPPTHPELLAALSESFIASGFDLKYLIRGITGSQTYQRTSRQTHASQAEAATFARMAVKGLTEEQVFDTLAEATGHFEAYRADQPFVLQQNTPRAEFLDLFRNESDTRTEQETTILQALAMMNGEFVALHTHLENSQTLAAVAETPFMSDADRVDTLFLAALSRLPRGEERERFVGYVKSGGAAGDRKTALADVFWALLNSSEFLLNH